MTGRNTVKGGTAYDVIVIGAGPGGLGCAARLAGKGRRVLVLEKNTHIGGTSYVFRRKGYTFPMGPLSFSFPELVRAFMRSAGVETEIGFRRNHFQLSSPNLDIVYSEPLKSLRDELEKIFPSEASGIKAVFRELIGIIEETKNIHLWHPDYRPEAAGRNADSARPCPKNGIDRVRMLSLTSCRKLLDRNLGNQALKNFLGSQGTSEPEMSLQTLAFMWNTMSEVGIWSPSCGVHGLSDLLADSLRRKGGEIRLGSGAGKIRAEKGRVTGVVTESGESLSAPWVVSNVDPKQTFLDMCSESDLPPAFRDRIASIPYTDSELCVYLGVDPGGIDWRRMLATHLFFLDHEQTPRRGPGALEDLDTREIEICRWSDNAPDHVPPGKCSLVLRVNFPYDHFAGFRTGEKKRRTEYQAHKASLTRKLIAAAEKALPGLGAAVEVVESATPLTYADWGRRYRGSIAGWTWNAARGRAFKRRLLVETPVENLLLAGIYAATELFLGGAPTALHTADLAARIISGDPGRPPRF